MNTVSKKANIGNNVTIGDYTVINDDVVIGNNVTIGSNVLIDNGARIADNVRVHHGGVVSSIPQDLKFVGEESILEVGDGTVIREYATLNRGTKATGKTTVGKNCLIMAYAHVAHDCILGNNVIMSNSANLAGHVFIDDWAIVGGVSGIHQFTRVGKHAIIAFNSRVVKDVPPYIMAGNTPLKYTGLNLTGLKRRNFPAETINLISEVYHVLYKTGLNVSDAVEKIKEVYDITDEVKEIISFIESSERGIILD